MHNELTKIDLEKMQQELDYRRITLRPQLLEEVKVARSFGDLSENFEYKAAKREKNRNDSRIRYLENMIKTAVVIEVESAPDEVGLFDTVEIYIEDEDETEVFQIVTTLRQNALEGRLSKESPLGKAIMGHKLGDKVTVKASADYSYTAVIKSITKGEDPEDVPISLY